MCKEICGECKYHTYEEIDRGYVCTNADSPYCTDWTDSTDTCPMWEQEENCNNCLFQSELIMWERGHNKEFPENYLPNYNNRLTCCTAMVRMSDGSNRVYGHTEKGNGMCEMWVERGTE